ncbi:MAG: hypothetical protein M0018_08750 [Nitrospiraceae bacterium]|nr:hypothetical protein [Nitrospiraceae bacterium]
MKKPQLIYGKSKFFDLALFAVLLAVLSACAGSSSGNTASAPAALPTGNLATTLSWNVPITNVDKSDLTDLSGFRIYYGISSGQYGAKINVPLSACDMSAGTCSYQVTGLAAVQYYFVVTALDSYGHESDYSKEVVKAPQ